jgi:hypothetical protein
MKFLLHVGVAWCVLVSSSVPVWAAGRCVRNRAVFGCVAAHRFVQVQRAVVVKKAVVADVVQEVVAVPVAIAPDY